MIYAKIILKIEFEMNMPMQGTTTVEEVKEQIDKEGGTDKFIEAMSAEVIKSMASPFSTGKVTSGTVEIVQI